MFCVSFLVFDYCVTGVAYQVSRVEFCASHFALYPSHLPYLLLYNQGLIT
jgi:hypothetical protein